MPRGTGEPAVSRAPLPRFLALVLCTCETPARGTGSHACWLYPVSRRAPQALLRGAENVISLYDPGSHCARPCTNSGYKANPCPTEVPVSPPAQQRAARDGRAQNTSVRGSGWSIKLRVGSQGVGRPGTDVVDGEGGFSPAEKAAAPWRSSEGRRDLTGLKPELGRFPTAGVTGRPGCVEPSPAETRQTWSGKNQPV
ncbi:hypothetical protein KIL84_021202 [Mauremys mutica]|uniref:Uncharacterized protein n=1 Tax=Mauremys mutica TaxID=74926 RepID=A0A9D3XBR5_9SAUR|nr:hypothetical protein KIL84_021202 [Mauremys mutica]